MAVVHRRRRKPCARAVRSPRPALRCWAQSDRRPGRRPRNRWTAMTTPTFLTTAQTRNLEAVCEALVPSIPPPAGGGDPGGLLGRQASGLDVARRPVGALSADPPESQALS